MKKTFNEYVEELIQTAQESIWKNEMAIEYTNTFQEGTEKDRELKIEACNHAIKRDKEYIEFLKGKII